MHEGGGRTWSAPRMVAAKLSATWTTSSIIEQPSSEKAHARMAGQALCWQAAIMAMATHSSRQKPSQSTAAVSRARCAWRLMARTQLDRSLTAVLAAAAPHGAGVGAPGPLPAGDLAGPEAGSQ